MYFTASSNVNNDADNSFISISPISLQNTQNGNIKIYSNSSIETYYECGNTYSCSATFDVQVGRISINDVPNEVFNDNGQYGPLYGWFLRGDDHNPTIYAAFDSQYNVSSLGIKDNYNIAYINNYGFFASNNYASYSEIKNNGSINLISHMYNEPMGLTIGEFYGNDFGDGKYYHMGIKDYGGGNSNEVYTTNGGRMSFINHGQTNNGYYFAIPLFLSPDNNPSMAPDSLTDYYFSDLYYSPSMSELVVGNNFIDTQQDMLFISNYGITKDSKRYEKNVFLTDGTTSPLKTINGESILGEGDIEVNGGFEVTNVNNDGTVSLALFTNESPSGTVNQLFFSGLYFEPYNGTLTIAASPGAGGGSITIGNHYRPVMPYYGYTNIRIWTGAQSDYDRMDKDDDTLYFITED